MSRVLAPQRKSEIILTGREFFRLRGQLDQIDPEGAVANIKAFPSFGFNQSVDGAKLVVRGSALDTAMTNSFRNGLSGIYYRPSEVPIEARLASVVAMDEPFGKTSVSLHIPEIEDRNTGNLALLKSIFQERDFENAVVLGISICPSSDLEALLRIAGGVVANVRKLLQTDEVDNKLRLLYASLNLAIYRNGDLDASGTIPSNRDDAPAGRNPSEILLAITDIIRKIKDSEEYRTLEALVCEKG